MQTLADLLNSEQGAAFLYSRGVFSRLEEFKAALVSPARPELAKLLGPGTNKPICSGQQVYLDYNSGVVAKMVQLQQLAAEKDLAPFFIWHDTDRSGSDPLITKFEWTMNRKNYPLKIAPPHQEEVEARFVTLDPALVQKVLETLKNYLFQSHLPDKKQVSARFEAFKEVFLTNSSACLSEFNFRLSRFLFEKQLGWSPPSLMLSALLEQNLLNEGLNQVLNNLTGFIRVYNQAIESLKQRGIDPKVRPLEDDHLPLYFSCETDNRRLRLHHSIINGDHFAVAKCKCGSEFKFFLGQKKLGVEELSTTARWSPDVSLPVFLNQQVSGFVMGKSSALYGLVMKEVLAKVLDQHPVPFLVPETLKNAPGGTEEPDSLIFSYLACKESPVGS